MTDHSPTPPSGAHRWLKCSMSAVLSQKVGHTPSSPAADLGTAAHKALSTALENELEPWELAGQTYEGHECDQDMLDAVEVAINECRKLITPATTVLIEQHLQHPKIPAFKGTLDFATVTSSLANILDYKHGQGVLVDVENNPQFLPYGFLLLQKYPSVQRVVFRVVQPRAHHPDGPVRRWETTAKYVKEWVRDVYIPGMKKTEEAPEYNVGEWCRFCPGKLICTAIKAKANRAAMTQEVLPGQMSNDELGTWFEDAGPIRMFLRAIEDETAKRLSAGATVPGAKLVARRADRTWKDGADKVFVEAFGNDAFQSPKVKTPAQMERIGSEAKALVKEYAYMPDAGLTVAPEADKRKAMRPPATHQVFSEYLSEAE